MRKKLFGMRLARLDCKRWKWIVFNVVTIMEAMVCILTVGFITPTWRGDLLFSEWMER